jgi:tripeptidyl-peptidase I
LVEGASFNNFLDAIDASYCTFRGGDSQIFDAPYPDPNPGGYKGPQDCGTYAATKVISTSYGYNEADLTPFYERRQCAEYLKLGLMGVSVLYSSGDYGVAGNRGQCIAKDGNYNNGNAGRFNPSFPSTCPWVTSVGATQVKPHISLPNALASGTEPEKACETVIYSGGGFSNLFPLPGYQANTVKSYFANYPPPYDSKRYNNSQETRGYPDISANGANYVIAVDGQFGLVYGTSASSPTLGSILTLINEEKFNRGLSSIGFVNPVAYKHPEVFNDIIAGNNPGCGTDGFAAVPGWDPVTGLGTPNYPKMLDLWLSLDRN